MKRATTKTVSKTAPKAAPKDAPKAAPKAPADAKFDIQHLLHKDHALVADLFFEFSQAEKPAEKKELVAQILSELYIHATVEEEIVYPAVRKKGEDVEDLMDEADTEHHMVKVLMAELANMEPSEKYFDAKVTVLCELVKHHVAEEEKEMFEKIEQADIDGEAVAKKVLARKEELKTQPMRLVRGDDKPAKALNGRARKTA